MSAVFSIDADPLPELLPGFGGVAILILLPGDGEHHVRRQLIALLSRQGEILFRQGRIPDRVLKAVDHAESMGRLGIAALRRRLQKLNGPAVILFRGILLRYQIHGQLLPGCHIAAPEEILQHRKSLLRPVFSESQSRKLQHDGGILMRQILPVIIKSQILVLRHPGGSCGIGTRKLGESLMISGGGQLLHELQALLLTGVRNHLVHMDQSFDITGCRVFLILSAVLKGIAVIPGLIAGLTQRGIAVTAFQGQSRADCQKRKINC